MDKIFKQYVQETQAQIETLGLDHYHELWEKMTGEMCQGVFSPINGPEKAREWAGILLAIANYIDAEKIDWANITNE